MRNFTNNFKKNETFHCSRKRKGLFKCSSGNCREKKCVYNTVIQSDSTIKSCSGLSPVFKELECLDKNH